MKAHKLLKLTVAEYINHEQESDTKYEYHDGKVYALAGGTIDHGTISGNVFGEIRTGLKNQKSNCRPFTSDIKISIEKLNRYVYPDAMVICGELEKSDNEANSITNPILIVEVLSKSSAEYDRGDKFYYYRQLKSFKEYVLIEQNRYVVDVHYKSDNRDLWRITRYEGLDKIVNLQSLGIEISMKDLYSDTDISKTSVIC